MNTFSTSFNTLKPRGVAKGVKIVVLAIFFIVNRYFSKLVAKFIARTFWFVLQCEINEIY